MKIKGNVVLPDRVLYGATVAYEDGVITDICEGKTECVDAALPYVLPGLVDIHNHGAMGHDYMEATEQAFDVISEYLVQHGITTSQCTTASAPLDDIFKVLDFFRAYKGNPYGCRFSGVHLEGPFIAPQSRGAHPLDVLKTPAQGYQWVLDNQDIVGELTVAPDLPEMPEMIRALVSAGIAVSGGHDACEPEDVIRGISAGMSHSTHIYCAMSTLHKTGGHRRSGLCEYIVTHDNITTEMIADEHHVPPQLAQMIYKCKGPDKLCLVSDGIAPSGLPESDEIYCLGTGEGCTKVRVEGGVALVEDRSCYAGSIQSLDRMISNVVRNSNIPFVDAVRMASLTPAQVIGIDKECGSIQVGKRADFCVMDSNFAVLQTIIAGNVVYDRG